MTTCRRPIPPISGAALLSTMLVPGLAADVVTIETSAGRIELPVYVRGGIRDDVIAVPIGQGHRVGSFASRDGAVRGAKGRVHERSRLRVGVCDGYPSNRLPTNDMRSVVPVKVG